MNIWNPIVAATEAFAEIEVVRAGVHVETVVTIAGVAVRETVAVVKAPAVQPVGASGIVAFRIAMVQGVVNQVHAVDAGDVVSPAAQVAVVRHRVEIGVATVIVVTVAPQPRALLAQPLQVFLLVAVLLVAPLSLQEPSLLLPS